jgi:hypothetical protein
MYHSRCEVRLATVVLRPNALQLGQAEEMADLVLLGFTATSSDPD